jgi:hypothetical protein
MVIDESIRDRTGSTESLEEDTDNVLFFDACPGGSNLDNRD